MADNVSTLTDSVPKIVITEPSPFPVTNPGLVQNVINASKEVIPASQLVTEASKSDLVPEANFPETAVECVTSDSDASCSVSVDDNKVQEVSMEVEEAGESLGQTIDTADEPLTEDGLTEVAEGACAACCRKLEAFTETRFMIAIMVVLSVVPIGGIYMGARYMDKCPLSNATPLFLFMMGLLGMMVITCRIAVIVKKIYSIECLNLSLIKSAMVFGCLALLVLFCTEMASFLRISPNFEPGTPNYCHRRFYEFTYWLNWTVLFTIAFLFVLHVPKCRRESGSENQS